MFLLYLFAAVTLNMGKPQSVAALMLSSFFVCLLCFVLFLFCFFFCFVFLFFVLVSELLVKPQLRFRSFKMYLKFFGLRFICMSSYGIMFFVFVLFKA